MTSPNPLVAARVDSTGTWDGFGIGEDIRDLAHGVSSGNWVDLTLGGFAASMDALGFVTDPLGSLVSWGVAWLMEHVKPLSDALDWLAGDPDQITAYAQTWRNVSASASTAAAQLRDAVARDLATWYGAAADTYRARARTRVAALDAASDAADTIALIVEGAGLVVAMVRGLVRDLIAEFVSVLSVRLWEWMAEEAGTLGIGTPWVVAQVSTLVGKWVAKIAETLKRLAGSLRQLAHRAGDLTTLIERLKSLFRRGDEAADDLHGTPASSHADEPTLAGGLEQPDPGDPAPAPQSTHDGADSGRVNYSSAETPPLHSRSGALSNREVADNNVGLPRNTDIVGHYANLAEVDFHGSPVEIIETPDDIAYLDYQHAVARTDSDGVQLGPGAFQDEETLVRTLGHESIHVEQYLQGRVSTVTGPLEAEAYAAEDRFVENWRRNSR